MLKKKYFRTKGEYEISFEFGADDAEQVSLVTEANGWEPVKMKKRRKDGIFYAKMRLPEASRFQFRYLVDGRTWVNDSAADAYVLNEYGDENAVVETAAA